MASPMTPSEKVDCVCVTTGAGPEGCGVCNETGARDAWPSGSDDLGPEPAREGGNDSR